MYKLSASVFLLLFFLGSCSKVLVEPNVQINDKSITVQEAQDYYESVAKIQSRSARKSGTKIESLNNENSPNWQSAVSKSLGGQEVIIIPIVYKKYNALRYVNDKPSNRSLSKNDSQIGLNETSFLYFYKDDLGGIIEDKITSIPTEEWAKNPTKRFSGYVMVSDNLNNFKRGIVFTNGEVSGGFSIGNPSKNARLPEICGYVAQWGYNYAVDGEGNITAGPYYIEYASIPIYCTLAPDISSGYQLPTNSYDGTGYYYNPPVFVTEEAYFTNTFISDPSNKNITNARSYLRCFSNSSNNIYKLTVSIDQPISGNSAPFNPFATGKHIVGHTFVTLTQVKQNGETIQRTLGLYPLYGGSVANPNVPSVLGDDSEYSGGWDVQLTFDITGSEMMQIVNYIPNYTNANYDLRNRTCGNFATDVLGQIGISVTPFWMNTYWYSSYNPYDPTGGTSSTIRGESIGALGEQMYNTPPSRTSSKSHAGGDAPKNLGTCN